MKCRGIRGATTVAENTEEAILQATTELLQALLAANPLELDDIACVIFTCTSDLNAAFPARSARALGFTSSPLLCTQELAVPGSLARCIRVLLMVNTELSSREVRHVYLRGAQALRPEFAWSADV